MNTSKKSVDLSSSVTTPPVIKQAEISFSSVATITDVQKLQAQIDDIKSKLSALGNILK
jgi:hypothetical protein